MNSINRKKTLAVLVTATLLLLFSSSAISFPTYSDGCKDCHGDFNSGNYQSKKDGTNWGTDLMSGHEDFFTVRSCDACHDSGGRKPVFLNQSADSSFSMSCVGCHGRTEDVNGNCSSEPGGVEVHCGSGDGLRAHHEREVGAGTCNDCHANPTPVGEDVTPFNYGKTGVSIMNSCDADGTESQHGATGLDNDGDGLADGADSDCQQANTPPTQPGTLSASAITVNSATVSWVASTDADGDIITYQVEYRINGVTPWTDGGSTNNTNRSLTGLDSATSYDVRVTPSDPTEAGTARTASNLFQTLNTPPTRPGTVSASAITVNSATVSWGASTDAEGDTISYQVEYRKNGITNWTDGGITNNTSQALSGLASATFYDVRVTPSDGKDTGAARTTSNVFQTNALNSPPTQPGTLSASAITENSATVSWGASTDVDEDPISYQVEYRRNGDVSWTSNGSTSSTSSPLTGLDPATSYDVRITPTDGMDPGPDRTELNLFQTFTLDEVVFKDSFE